MTAKTAQIAEMIDMLPESDKDLAYELIKKLVLAWDPDFTRVTPKERKEIEEAEQSGYISANEIDWDNLDKIV